MAIVMQTDVEDFLTSTLASFERFTFHDIASRLTKYIAFRKLAKRVTMDGGERLEFFLMHDHNQAARNVGLFYQANRDTPKVMTSGFVDWRHLVTNYAYERRLVAMNRGNKYRLLEYVKTQRAAGYLSLAELWERNFWVGASTSTDTTGWYGLEHYWLFKPASYNSTPGAQGENPANFTAGRANISTTTFTGWDHYYDRYTNISPDDLVLKILDAMYETDFLPPMPEPNAPKRDIMMYSKRAVTKQLSVLARQQNDQVGSDLGRFEHSATIANMPVVPVPFLDKETTTYTDDPVLGIDWDAFGVKGLETEWMREFGPHFLKETQPTVAAVDLDCTGNTYCNNLRTMFRIGTSG